MTLSGETDRPFEILDLGNTIKQLDAAVRQRRDAGYHGPLDVIVENSALWWLQQAREAFDAAKR